MKSGPVVVGIASVMIVAGLIHAFARVPGDGLGQASPSATRREGSPVVVNVDELARNARAYPGEITLRAVVARTNTSQGVVLVVDSREFESCGEITCAANYLPVKIPGTLPAPKTVWLISGRIVRNPEGLVFEAAQVKKAP